MQPDWLTGPCYLVKPNNVHLSLNIKYIKWAFILLLQMWYFQQDCGCTWTQIHSQGLRCSVTWLVLRSLLNSVRLSPSILFINLHLRMKERQPDDLWHVSLPQGQTPFPDLPSATRHLGQNILRCGSLILVIQQHRGCFTECRAVYLTNAGTLSSRVEILLPRAAVMSMEPSSEHLYFLCVSLLSFAPWRYVTCEQNL